MKEEKRIISEELLPGVTVHYNIEKILCEKQSEFQNILVGEIKGFGKALFLNSILQSVKLDEEIYHETLVHPPFFFHPSPESVLILGGGEGATLREVLKYPLKKVVMVDIDQDVVEISKKFLPEWSNGAYKDPRVELVFDDALNFVSKTSEKFDIIISDLTDPFIDTLSLHSFTKEFFSLSKKVLKEDGIICVQSGAMDPHFYRNFLTVEKNIQSAFKYVIPYARFIYSFFSVWGFHLASDVDYFSTKNLKNIKNDIKLKYISEDNFFLLIEKAKFYQKEVEKYGEGYLR
ncbi:MAG: methyltransferase domain-containing protein [candidate division WOR-3 bacterium]